MIDKYGRKIDYLRISLTDKCNLRCVYCMPPDVKFDKNYINENLRFEDYKFIIKAMAEQGITKIRFTGGEPLLYPKLNELIKFTKEECGINNIGMTTNAIGLSDRIFELEKCGLNKVNISLDSLKEYKYKSITRGGNLKDVLKSIESCLNLGIKVKLNCVAISGFNDDELKDFMFLTVKSPIDVRFIELMPLGEANRVYKKGYFNVKEMIEKIYGLYKVKNDEKSTAEYYMFKGAKGRIGIITPLSCSFCNTCNRIRLTSSGAIKLCLHSKEEIDIKPFLHKPLLFRESMKDIIKQKPEKHHLIENKCSDTNRRMYEIGG
ncbi:TPA: GTP 3',8-cyclase MoaA [Clostridioides difficile]